VFSNSTANSLETVYFLSKSGSTSTSVELDECCKFDIVRVTARVCSVMQFGAEWNRTPDHSLTNLEQSVHCTNITLAFTRTVAQHSPISTHATRYDTGYNTHLYNVLCTVNTQHTSRQHKNLKIKVLKYCADIFCKISACLDVCCVLMVHNQWRTQEFCSAGGGSTNSVEDRENGDLGAVAQ